MIDRKNAIHMRVKRLAGRSRRYARRLIASAAHLLARIEEGHRARRGASLDVIGLARGIGQASSGDDHLRNYQRHFEELPIHVENLVLICAGEAEGIANTFAEFLPSASIHLLSLDKGRPVRMLRLKGNVRAYDVRKMRDFHNALRKIARIQVIIEDGTDEDGTDQGSLKRSCFKELFFYLEPDGLYAIEDPRANGIEGFNGTENEGVGILLANVMHEKARMAAGASGPKGFLRELADSVGQLTTYDKIAFVSKSGRHLFKLRDHEATETLTSRYGSRWGSVLQSNDGGSFESLARTTVNRSDLSARFPQEIRFPATSARRYSGPIVFPGQVVIYDDLVLPDSFRHLEGKHLKNRNLAFTSERFTRLPGTGVDGVEPPELPGQYFYLDTEHPGVYGHVTTEVVSRLWAWRSAKAKYPELKALVCPVPGSGDIPPYERHMLNAYGICDADIFLLDQPAKVETLIAATPMFSNPKFVVPRIRSVWEEIRSNLCAPEAAVPSKVFITRPPGSVRNCRNGGELESLFASYGFTVLRPELLPLGEQVRLFANCEVIAGYGGSAMLSAVFSSKPRTTIVVAPDTYITANEYLIASVFGGDFHYFWSAADIPNPPGKRLKAAFTSSFEFDFERDGDQLIQLLSSLDKSESGA